MAVVKATAFCMDRLHVTGPQAFAPNITAVAGTRQFKGTLTDLKAW